MVNIKSNFFICSENLNNVEATGGCGVGKTITQAFENYRDFYDEKIFWEECEFAEVRPIKVKIATKLTLTEVK